MTGSWTQARERGGARLLPLMIWLTARLGLGVGHALLHLITVWYLAAAAGPRRHSAEFLARALGRAPGWRERYRHFHSFAQTIMDRVLLAMGRGDALTIAVTGREVVDAMLARGRGCILLGAHIGSFEVLRAVGALCPAPVKVMMYDDQAPRLHGVLAALDPAAHAAIIRLGRPEATLRAKEALDAGAILGILGDRIVAGDKVVAADFLGAPAIFPAGPIVLASVLKAPVVLCFAIHVERQRYAVEFELLAEEIVLPRGDRAAELAAWTRRYAAAVERRARAHPFNWFNFYDFWRATVAAPGARPGAAGGAVLR